MNTHVPDRVAVKTLLDAEGLERTFSRIAHEIIERNDDLSRLALVIPPAASTRLVAPRRRERSGVDRLGASTSPSTAMTRVLNREGDHPVVRATEPQLPLRG